MFISQGKVNAICMLVYKLLVNGLLRKSIRICFNVANRRQHCNSLWNSQSETALDWKRTNSWSQFPAAIRNCRLSKSLVIMESPFFIWPVRKFGKFYKESESQVAPLSLNGAWGSPLTDRSTIQIYLTIIRSTSISSKGLAPWLKF